MLQLRRPSLHPLTGMLFLPLYFKTSKPLHPLLPPLDFPITHYPFHYNIPLLRNSSCFLYQINNYPTPIWITVRKSHVYFSGNFTDRNFCRFQVLSVLSFTLTTLMTIYNCSSFSHRQCNFISNNFTKGCCHLGALNQDIALTATPLSQLLHGGEDNLTVNHPFSLVCSNDNSVLHLWKQGLLIAASTRDRLMLPNQSCQSCQICSPSSFLNCLNSSLNSSVPIIGLDSLLLTVLPENVGADTKMLVLSSFTAGSDGSLKGKLKS